MNKALFLDRDGTINVDTGYVHEPEHFIFIDGIFDFCREAQSKGYLVIVITSQSGIERGYFTEAELKAVDARMNELLEAEGAHIDATYYCYHHKKGVIPEYAVDCDCRKPKPGLFLRAAKDLDIDLAASFMIGDKESDLEAGINAGCKGVALVRTGHGVHQNIEKIPQAVDVGDVLTAAKELLSRYPCSAK